LGDTGKCGRDCIYYVTTKLGIPLNLQSLDNQLKNPNFASVREIQQIFQSYDLDCKSYYLNIRQLDLLSWIYFPNKIYVIITFPDKDDSINNIRHFVVLLKHEGNRMMVYDPSLNKIRAIDCTKLIKDVKQLPILIISKKECTPNIFLLSLKSKFYKLFVSWTFAVCFLLFSIIVFLFNRFPIRKIYMLLRRISKSQLNTITINKYYLFVVLSVVIFILASIIGVITLNKKVTILHMDNQSIDLAECELSTYKVFDLIIENKSSSPVEFSVKTSCGCLQSLDESKIIHGKSKQKFSFSLTAQLEGENSYQIIIKPKNTGINPILANVKYFGIRKSKIVPLQQTISNFLKTEHVTKKLRYYLADFRDSTFILESVKLAHPKSHLVVRCNSLGLKSNGDFIEIEIDYKGTSTCGKWEDAILFVGSDKSSGKQLVFISHLIGCITCETCQKNKGFQ
jgi:hypothetical protein